MPHYRDWFAAAASKAVVQPGAGRLRSKHTEAGLGGVSEAELLKESVKEVGWWTVDGANFRHGSKTDEGLIIPTECDDSVVRPEADGFMKLGDIKGEFAGAYESSIGGFQSDALTNGGQEGFTWEGASDIWTNGGASTFNADALVQQVNGTIGYEVQPDEYFSHNPEWFAPGSAVDALGASNPMGIEPNQMGGVISRGDMFAPVNELRSDNRF